MFSVSEVTAVGVSVSLGDEAASGASELEGPHDVVDLLEVGAAGVQFVDDVLDADATFLGKGGLYDLVVGNGDSGLLDFEEASLVAEVLDGLQTGVAEGHEGLHSSEHVDGGLVEFDQHCVVQLSQPEQSHDLLDIWV